MPKWTVSELRRLNSGVEHHGANWTLLHQRYFPYRNPDALKMQHRRRGAQSDRVKPCAAWTSDEEEIITQWYWNRGPSWRELELSGKLPNRTANSIRLHHKKMPATSTSAAAKPALSPPASPQAVRARPSSKPFEELDVGASLTTVCTTQRHVGRSWTASVQLDAPCPAPTSAQRGFTKRWRLREAAGGAKVIAVDFRRAERILQRYLQRTEGLSQKAAEKAAKKRQISLKLRDELKMVFYAPDSLPTARENPGSRLWLGGPGMGAGRLERPEEMLAQHGVRLDSPQQRAAKHLSLSKTTLWQAAGDSMHAVFADMLLANAFAMARWTEKPPAPVAYGSCWSGGLDAIYGVARHSTAHGTRPGTLSPRPRAPTRRPARVHPPGAATGRDPGGLPCGGRDGPHAAGLADPGVFGQALLRERGRDGASALGREPL